MTSPDINSEEKLAKNLVRLLDESTLTLDASITSKLAVGRERAVSSFLVKSGSIQGRFGLLHTLRHYLHQHRALMSGAALVCAVLVAFMATQQLVVKDAYEQSDAFLLGSELPPEAYADKGFDTWLAQNSQH